MDDPLPESEVSVSLLLNTHKYMYLYIYMMSTHILYLCIYDKTLTYVLI